METVDRRARIVELVVAKVRPALEAGAAELELGENSTDEQEANRLLKLMLDQLDGMKHLLE